MRLARQRHGRQPPRARHTSATSASTSARRSRARRRIVGVGPDGSAARVADDLLFPNGTVVTDDGSQSIVGETWAARLTQFTIRADGALVDRETFAAVPRTAPDGCTLDADGCVWFADARSNRCLRVARGGEIREVLTISEELRLLRLHARGRRRPYARDLRGIRLRRRECARRRRADDARRHAARRPALVGRERVDQRRQLAWLATKGEHTGRDAGRAERFEALPLLVDGPSRKISRTSASGASSSARARSPADQRIDQRIDLVSEAEPAEELRVDGNGRVRDERPLRGLERSPRARGTRRSGRPPPSRARRRPRRPARHGSAAGSS